MTTDTDAWTKYKNIFLNREVTVEIIHKYLLDTYGISLKTYTIDVIPHTRWKYKLDENIKKLSNIVYINCYVNGNGESKPFICGVTKTGEYRTTDFNFDINVNENRQTYPISGRAFLKESKLSYNTSVIYMFECPSKNQALLLERDLQYRFGLFGS